MLEKLEWYSSNFAAPDWQSLSEPLPDWLANASAQWPDKPAVKYGDQTWTYNDLSHRAAGLAIEIAGATRATGPVALLQSVGFDAIAAWFACAMAGRAFLLLETDQPPARLLELINAAGCPLVLCDRETSQALGHLSTITSLVPTGLQAKITRGKRLNSSDPAMIFPTSGSTGTPKLVTYSATTLQVKAQSSKKLMQVPSGGSVVIAGSHGNYGFMHHAFVFLLSGGTICLADVKAGGFTAVLQAIDRLGARHVRFTPSMFRKMAALPQAHAAMRKLDAVRFSGEPLLVTDLDLARSVLKPDCLIQNVYGSTESALFIWSSSNDQSVPPATGRATVPIGQLYPLSSCAIVPIDTGSGDEATGELVIRSEFHALGDFRNGEIDQTRFPLWPGSSRERTYATGDIVRRLENGDLIHLGRNGRMVKIRGHRVFPAEIENHLRALDGIVDAVVIERVEKDNPVLYAFITVHKGKRPVEEPRRQLSNRLPDYMVPRVVQTVTQIPLTPGGKVDFQSLLAQLPMKAISNQIERTAQDAKHTLNQVWDNALWQGAHAHDADFLSLGGDSLALMTLSIEIERVFERKMPLEEFLANSTLRNLAVLLDINEQALKMPVREGLLIRQLWPGLQPSKGIALAMPGWTGKATGVPFGRAGLFPEYDLWVADYEITGGNMRNNQRWWHAAQDIVERIQSGAIPAPQLIFGYSFGGSLAWLVSRLLAGNPNGPKFVVMVDAAPLHRLRGFRGGQLSQALKRLSHIAQTPTLHIRRAPLAKGYTPTGSTSQWQVADQISMLINLPTVDHAEVVHRDVLSLAAKGTLAFMNGKYSNISIDLPEPDLLGVQIHQMLSGKQKVTTSALDKLIYQNSASSSGDKFIALLHLTIQHGGRDKGRAFIDAAVSANPQSKLMQYARQRENRSIKMLCPSDMPSFFPASLAALDQALASNSASTIRPAPRPVMLLCAAWDVCRALYMANRHGQP